MSRFKMVQLLWKTAWLCLKKLNVISLYDPIIHFQVSRREIKTYAHKKTCSEFLQQPLLIIGPKPGKNQMYVEERMDEQNVVYPFSGRPCDKEKNEPVLHVIKQMKL